MKKKMTLATEAGKVSDYLTAYAYMLADVINSKGMDKKDAKWLKECVVSIIQTQTVIDIAVAYNEVMKKYSPKEQKRMVKLLAEYK